MKNTLFGLWGAFLLLTVCTQGMSDNNTMTVVAMESISDWKEMPVDSYKTRLDLPGETIYELIGTDKNLGYSCAIADIIESQPHYHKHTAEAYVMLAGIAEVTINDVQHVLYPGDVLAIPLNGVHFVRSLTNQPARILVSCVPGWTAEDHLFTGGLK